MLILTPLYRNYLHLRNSPRHWCWHEVLIKGRRSSDFLWLRWQRVFTRLTRFDERQTNKFRMLFKPYRYVAVNFFMTMVFWSVNFNNFGKEERDLVHRMLYCAILVRRSIIWNYCLPISNRVKTLDDKVYISTMPGLLFTWLHGQKIA